jgi:molecular chaperone DnaK
VEDGVVEILASHGDTHLGGDDFDQLLLDFVCDGFKKKHGIDLRASLAAKSRLLHAVEEAKKQLSFEAVSQIQEEYITEKDGVPLHLTMEIDRCEYEGLIEPLLFKTLGCLDRALSDAKLQAHQIKKVLLVGGATRTPLVHRLLEERLGRPVHAEIEPDLAVAMGAAVQGGLINGADVGPVLVDITPHTLGVECLGMLNGVFSQYKFAPVIPRNTPLPTTRSELFSTAVDGQEGARIRVFQGEDECTQFNTLVGEVLIEGLADVSAGNQVVVRLDLDLSGMLKVTATERATGLARQVTIDSAMERFRKKERVNAIDRIEEMFGTSAGPRPDGPTSLASPAHSEERADRLPPELQKAVEAASELIAKAERVLDTANAEDASELGAMLTDLRSALERRSETDIRKICNEMEDLVFYLHDA